MPDILIQGMEMPKDDGLLSINIWPNGNVTIAMDLECKPVAKAVELPKHGDLIDRSELLEKAKVNGMYPHWIDTMDVKRAPVVVPAERSEEDG